MKSSISDGIWPTMITPFTADNEIDFSALEAMVEWYIANGVHGLFAVCQSSEMFHLTLDERVRLAKFVKDQAKGRVPVIASGHVSDLPKQQFAEIAAIADTGIDAFVLVTNRLAIADESDDVWIKRAETVLRHFPDVPFGFYECPYPYKRLLTPKTLKWCADTGQFLFLKDTSCDLEQIKDKLAAVAGSHLKIFNANSATLLDSLHEGVSGFSGVMANFHPALYVWLVENWRKHPETAAWVQSLLGVASLIERQPSYPVSARYHMQLEGLDIKLHGRKRKAHDLTRIYEIEIEQLRALCKRMQEIVCEE